MINVARRTRAPGRRTGHYSHAVDLYSGPLSPGAGNICIGGDAAHQGPGPGRRTVARPSRLGVQPRIRRGTTRLDGRAKRAPLGATVPGGRARVGEGYVRDYPATGRG